MSTKLKTLAAKLSLIGAGLLLAGAANAGAIITNGTVTLGVNNEGHLNVGGGAPSSGGTTTVGLRYNARNAESTAPGCLCEGWGAGLLSRGISGYANVSTNGGANNLSLVSFTSTATTATSMVRIGSALEVTHFYHPSSIANLYQVDVSLKNISGSNFAAGDLVYRRVMDWDVEPTAFNEFVTIAGVPGALGLANGNNIRRTGDNGFDTANPLTTNGATISCAQNANFTDCGPRDHGAVFDFEFEALAAGATRTFATYYGAAGNEADALAALASVGAGLYSLGQSSVDPATGTPNTFIFGFGSTRGGVLTPPPSVPEPGSLALAGLGLGVMALRRRQKKSAY